MIQVMSFEEWVDDQDPDSVFEWGQTTNKENSLMEHMKRPFREVPDSTKHFFYDQYVHDTVGKQNEKINSSKPKDKE